MGGFLTIICTVVVLVISVTKGGVSAVTVEVLLVVVWSIALLIGIAMRYEERTQQGALAKIRKRQKRRRDQPRDLVALATASASTRRRWYLVARRRARFASLPQLALAVPIVLFFVSRGVSPMYELYHPLGWGLAVIGTLGGVALILWSVRKQWGDPLLFVGQVEEVQHGLWKEGAVNWMAYGRTRTVDLVPRAICRLGKDGALRSHSVARGKQILGVRRAVARK